ncbi:hypothetical protein ONE63_000007 [Megalurothrips usitatus]|uniref:Uncharacterized protein n=1 Tax=Megalurothrips usitatus TaxID=439358 RepID=A0AAV7Y220_9NEOP|nr:hypothetical protein ONE63_000007 [Megalurothrips usitatus]
MPDSLPCSSTVESFVAQTATPVKQGEFRFQELVDFLKSHQYPMKVFIGEDGTRIKSVFQYDFATNLIVGPVLPLSDVDGTPIVTSFPATSAALIAKHFIHGEPASSAYVVMAQPLSEGAPPFLLSMYGTNNCFKAEDVTKRHRYITKELEKYGVEVIGYAADGDPKLLKSMRAHMFPPNAFVPEIFKDLLHCDFSKKETMIQDTIHVLNRFKTRLLKPSIILPMGNFIASSSHLKIIINSASKAEHGLTEYDLTKSDKMNFNATMKMCSTRVLSSMKQNVIGSEATITYLQLIKNVELAFLDKSLSPLQKIYNMWFVVSFLRIWRQWIKASPVYTMENFITMNMYIGIEINAHGIIKLIRHLRDTNAHDLLLTDKFSSQFVEKYLGKARSMTTTESTVINFSMLEFLQKAKRIEFLSDVTCRLDNFVFPRDSRKRLLDIQHSSELSSEILREALPWDCEIKAMLDKALLDAENAAAKLGMKALAAVCTELGADIDLSDEFYDDVGAALVSGSSDPPGEGEDDIPLDILAAFPSDVSVLNSSIDLLSDDVDGAALPPTSKFVNLNIKGKLVCMRKTTLCWLLRTEGPSISSDRLLRVKAKVI